MKIALTSIGKELTSDMDPRFGRCAYFIVVDPDGMLFEALENENKDLNRGAGIQAATFITSKDIDAVVTGRCGPNALQVLSAVGIDLYTGESGKTVMEAIERFKSGRLLVSKMDDDANQNVLNRQNATNKNLRPTVSGSGPENYGMGTGRGMGRGMGRCRKNPGMGGGRGMGGNG
jgi:predicted Fe-Mo cluster-binding NifX family protein